MTWLGRVAVLATAVLAYKNRDKLAAWMQGGEHAGRGAEAENDGSGTFRGVGASAAARNRTGQPSDATADSRFSGGAPQA